MQLVSLAAGIVLALTANAQSPSAASPFGPNVFVFNPAMPAAGMQQQIDRVYAEQQHAEFGRSRYAFLLEPGEYKLNLPIGFYTAVLGLGESPDQVHLAGDVHVDAAAPNNNATTTFWRAAEGFSISPLSGTMQWAVSQAVSFRRMHVLGNMVLNQDHGWASGGWIADTLVDGTVNSGTQQQWISRNAEWRHWTGANWNMVFVGVKGAPPGDWPQPPYTRVATTPVVREKPFLVHEGTGFAMVVPNLMHETSGTTWHDGHIPDDHTAGDHTPGDHTPGRHVPLAHFYIAHAPADTAASLNAALARGQDLLLTPGIYDLTAPLQITRPDTIVFGLGFATLHPTRGNAAMTVADVDGVTIAGLLFDAGALRSPVLLEVGPTGSHRPHIADPTSLHDVFFRVGGEAVGKVGANLVLNSNDTLVDHTWIWRADHGNGVGWTENVSDNGLIVNGSDITIYGLFVEHHQQFQVLWNGERGRTFFYQSEIPYDPPTQAAWRSTPSTEGWASYKVSDTVRQHEAWGLGCYSVFRHPGVQLTRAIETPTTPGIAFHHMITVALDNLGQITHIINNSGETATTGPHHLTPKLTDFPLQPHD